MKPGTKKFTGLLVIGIIAVVSAVVFLSHLASNQIQSAKITIPAELEAKQKAKSENKRLTNQIIADRVVRDIIYIQDPRNRVVFSYDKRSGSMAHITGYSVPSSLLYVANVGSKE